MFLILPEGGVVGFQVFKIVRCGIFDILQPIHIWHPGPRKRFLKIFWASTEEHAQMSAILVTF